MDSLGGLAMIPVFRMECKSLDAVTSRMISRRDFLGSQFLEWNEFVSKRGHGR
jgi:hypothetical protein